MVHESEREGCTRERHDEPKAQDDPKNPRLK